MKNIKPFNLSSILFISSILYLSGCDRHNDVNSPYMESMNYNSVQYTVLDYKDFRNGINDATLDSDIALDNSLLGYTFMNMMGDFNSGNQFMRGIPWLEEFDYTRQFGGTLHSLNLNDGQKTSIIGFVRTYHDSIKSLVKQFNDANKDIITAANTLRKAIADSVRNGQLTRQQAMVKIQALNQNTKTQIENNPASLAIKSEICQTRKTLFDNIASILNSGQLTTWNSAIAKIPSSC